MSEIDFADLRGADDIERLERAVDDADAIALVAHAQTIVPPVDRQIVGGAAGETALGIGAVEGGAVVDAQQTRVTIIKAELFLTGRIDALVVREQLDGVARRLLKRERDV